MPYFGPFFGPSGSSELTSPSWYYADKQDVEDLIGAEALRLISNEPGVASDASADTARIVRIGQLMDAFIDGRMATLGFVTPMTGMSDATVLIMANISASLVSWKLNEPRMLTSLSSSRQANAIDTIMSEHRKAAEALLVKIAIGQVQIVADRTFTRPPYGKVSLRTWSDATYCGTVLVQ